jgi:gluconolactonase
LKTRLHLLPALLACLLEAGLARAGIEVIDPHAQYPESPLWYQEKLLYVEYTGNGISSWDGKQKRSFWNRPKCGANGLLPFRGDHLLVACYDGNFLVELDAQGKEVQTYSKDSLGHAFVGPNDLTSDGHGGAYFSASGVYDLKAPITGKVFQITADGKTVRKRADTIHYSNGLTLTHDGTHLLVAEMLAGRILSFPIEPDGSLGPRVVWARLQDLAPPTPHEDGYNGPDGLKAGSDGNYYIAQNGSGRILVVSEDKKLVRSIEVPTPYVTNVGFGPDGPSTLFITGAFDQWKAPYPSAVYRWTR